MTTETFLENFGHLLDAPNGIAKLRELILQLAVQGKLVAQDPEDEPASKLLEKILKARNLIRQQLPIENSFTIPENWVLTTVGEVFDFQYGKSMSQKNRNDEGKIPVYGSNGRVGFHDEALVT